MKKQIATRTLAGILAVPVFISSLLLAQKSDEEEEVFELSPFTVDSGGFGVTAGGAQDISFTRSEIAAGKIPQPSSFTAEGLLSEYDLPLAAPSDCNDLICVYGEAMSVTLPELPEATYLAQIGFASGIDSKTWQRAPLNLVAVVDKSGSMSGKPLQLVRESLLEVLDQLDERDQISIVLYGDRSHVYLEPIRASRSNKERIQDSIRNIASAGSTNLESGLRVGYELADRTAPEFQGSTRLMLFTDERPNTGNTSEHGFMTQMRNGSNKGYGLTTIGVGTHFGAELANSISAVRGGNLFYFPDYSSMRKKFSEEFSTMVTELAYDMRLTLSPARGFRIAGVYGIPGDMLRWTDDGRSLYMEVETLFLSLRKGAIYFALAPDGNRFGENSKSIASASLAYEVSQQAFPITQEISLALKNPKQASLGLLRGEALIDEYVSLKKATTLFHQEGNPQEAYRIVKDLSERFRWINDSEIAPERTLVEEIERNLKVVAGKRKGLFGRNSEAPILGTWTASERDNPHLGQNASLSFHSGRIVEGLTFDQEGRVDYKSFAFALSPFSNRRQGDIQLIDEGLAYRTPELSERLSELEEDGYYWEDISRIRYKVREDELHIVLFDEYGNQENELTLRRSANIECFTPSEAPVEIEPITGLPSRG